MNYNAMGSRVRQRLHDKKGQVYCADCLAKDIDKTPRKSGRLWTSWRPARTSRQDIARGQAGSHSAGSCACPSQDRRTRAPSSTP